MLSAYSKKIAAAVWLLALTLPLLWLPGCTDVSSKVEKIFIFTGGTSGTYYPLGEALADIINTRVDGVKALAVISGGSVENALAIEARDAGLALIQNDIADYAFQGSEMFAGSAVSGIRGIAAWYPETIQFVTLKESGIRSIEDLKGKRVAVGAPLSGVKTEAMAILDAAGINPENTVIRDMDFREVVIALQDRSIDAGCIVAGVPTPAVVEAAGNCDIYILEITDQDYDILSRKHSFFIRAEIASGVYRGLDKDIRTAAVMSMLATRADISENTVYNITRAMFETLETLGSAHIRGKDININTALDGMTIPLHPGAEKYYREKGLLN